jgi:hypothetical protein
MPRSAWLLPVGAVMGVAGAGVSRAGASVPRCASRQGRCSKVSQHPCRRCSPKQCAGAWKSRTDARAGRWRAPPRRRCSRRWRRTRCGRWRPSRRPLAGWRTVRAGILSRRCGLGIRASLAHRQGRLFEPQATPIMASRIELQCAPRLRKASGPRWCCKQPWSPRGDPGSLYFR